jgi:hypothetical protein
MSKKGTIKNRPVRDKILVETKIDEFIQRNIVNLHYKKFATIWKLQH